MATRNDLVNWVREALAASGGSTTIIETARHIWQHHEKDIVASGDLLFTWQYDMRWAAQRLRNGGQATFEKRGGKSYWILTRKNT